MRKYPNLAQIPFIMVSKSEIKIHSLPVNTVKYGSKNDTPVLAIGVFDLNHYELTDYEIIRFQFPNLIHNRIEEVKIPEHELKRRLSIRNQLLNDFLVLWLLPDGHLFNVTNIGIEGEWYFIAGGMAKNTEMDFTEFHMKP